MIVSKQGSEFYSNFTKDIFNTIKGISDDERGNYIIQTYENLYGRLSEEDNQPSGVSVDLAKLREELSHIRGIGGQRLDEIMAVIERNLFPEPKNSQDNADPDSSGKAEAENT